jgi:hypothetical protein
MASAVVARLEGRAQHLDLEILPSDPATDPAPICVLCDHEVVGMSLRREPIATGEVILEPIGGAQDGGLSVGEAAAGAGIRGALEKPG